ncbi:MAG: CocE/NonD family hydrolase [Luteibaculum sp.]
MPYPKSFLLVLGLCLSFTAFSQLNYTTVQIPMRDGKMLAADVYVPNHCSTCPAVLIQTPYNKNTFRFGLPLGYRRDLEDSPFAWVIVDWRGFYGSAAAAAQGANRGQDGFDVIDWIKDQTWSNGKIGTWGPSALGKIQYQTAQQQHPNHTCAVPLVAHPRTGYEDYFYGGVLEASRLNSLDSLGFGLSTFVMANVYYSNTWVFAENNTWYPEDISIPTLQIGGWYDHNIDVMIDWYSAVKNEAPTAVKNQQWLLVGPWVHGGTGPAFVGSDQQGELTYPAAARYSDSMAVAFFRYHLLDEPNNWEQTPAVYYYELGGNTGVWNGINATQLETALPVQRWYFKNNGILEAAAPPVSGEASFTSNPRNPSPSLGGHTLSQGLDQGPYDQRPLDTRTDLLYFESVEAQAQTRYFGRPVVHLRIKSSQPDVDLAARLVDVYPDGRKMLLNDGIQRLRFRNGYRKEDEAFLDPQQFYNVEVQLPFLSFALQPGHRLGIYISGNSATRWHVNSQDGSDMYKPTDTAAAKISLEFGENAYLGLPAMSVVGMEEEQLQANRSLRIFPNPAGDRIYFSEELSSIKVFDAKGRLLFAEEGKLSHLDWTGFKPGLYFLSVELGGKTEVHRIEKF